MSNSDRARHGARFLGSVTALGGGFALGWQHPRRQRTGADRSASRLARRSASGW